MACVTRTPGTALAQDVPRYLLLAALAGLASAMVVGVYLFLFSLPPFRLNFNELFAGQRIESFKGFLRMHVDTAGTLTIYVIGLRRVRWPLPGFISLHWRVVPKGTETDPWFEPRFGRRIKQTLVEKVVVPGPARAPSSVAPSTPMVQLGELG